jgi:hypothetical protein
LNLADRVTGRIYIRFESGQLKWIDSEPFASVDHDNDERAALAFAAPQIFEPSAPRASEAVFLRPERFHTIGRWLHDAVVFYLMPPLVARWGA